MVVFGAIVKKPHLPAAKHSPNGAWLDFVDYLKNERFYLLQASFPPRDFFSLFRHQSLGLRIACQPNPIFNVQLN